MDDSKLVSVIIPVYNGENIIDRCLKSILNQTYKNIEIIVVNDGSTDDTLGAVSLIDDSRIKYYSIDNKGVSDARNYGLEKSTGEYIAFVDCDDIIHEDMIHELVYQIEENNADIAACRYERVFYHDRRTVSTGLERKVVLSNIQALDGLNYGREISASVCDKLFVRRIISDEVRFPSKIVLGEDYTFLVNALVNAKIVVAVPDVFYYYNQNGNSACHKGFSEDSRAAYDNYIKVYENLSLNLPEAECGAFVYLTLQQMAVVVSMTKSGDYDNKMLSTISRDLRKVCIRYIKDSHVSFYLKACILMIVFMPHLFIGLYNLFFRNIRDRQTVEE